MADTERKGKLIGKIGVDFLKKSDLSKDILKRIWYISSQTDPQWLERDDFYIALRLIALAQNNMPITEEAIRINSPLPPLPRFNLQSTNQQQLAFLSSMTQTEDLDAVFALDNNEIQKYTRAFNNAKEYDNKISLQKGIQMWKKANVSEEAISNIYKIVSPMKENEFMDISEFIVCTHLALKSFQKEIPKALPKSLSSFLQRKERIDSNQFNQLQHQQLQQHQLWQQRQQQQQLEEERQRQQELVLQQHQLELERKRQQEKLLQREKQQQLEKEHQEELIKQQQKQQEFFQQQLERRRQQEILLQQQQLDMEKQNQKEILLQQQRQQELIRQQQLEIEKQNQQEMQRQQQIEIERQRQLLLQQQVNHPQPQYQQSITMNQFENSGTMNKPMTQPQCNYNQDQNKQLKSEQEMEQVKGIFEEIEKVILSLNNAKENNNTTRTQIQDIRSQIKKCKENLIKMSQAIPQKSNEIEISREELAKVKASFLSLMNEKQQLETEFMKEKIRMDKIREHQALFNKTKEEEMKRNAETMKRLDNSFGFVQITDQPQQMLYNASPIIEQREMKQDIIKESPIRSIKEPIDVGVSSNFTNQIIEQKNELNPNHQENQPEVFDIHNNEIKENNNEKDIRDSIDFNKSIEKKNNVFLEDNYNNNVNNENMKKMNENDHINVKLDDYDNFDPYAEIEALESKSPKKEVNSCKTDLENKHKVDNNQHIKDVNNSNNNTQSNRAETNFNFKEAMSPINNIAYPAFDSGSKNNPNTQTNASQKPNKPEDFDTFDDDFKKYAIQSESDKNKIDFKDDWDF